jgi:hypothetical protein
MLFSLDGLTNGTYWVYARDTVVNISEPQSVVIVGVGMEPRSIGSFITYPNPFSKETSLRFFLEEHQQLRLVVYDSRGEMVRWVPLGSFAPGEHQVDVLRGDLTEGIYIFRLENETGRGSTGKWIIRE